MLGSQSVASASGCMAQGSPFEERLWLRVGRSARKNDPNPYHEECRRCSSCHQKVSRRQGTYMYNIYIYIDK